jgi:molybdate transport system substrate-binding protein
MASFGGETLFRKDVEQITGFLDMRKYGSRKQLPPRAIRPLAMIPLLIFFYIIGSGPSFSWAEELYVFAGAGLRQPLDEIIHVFEQETGHRILVDYGGSGQLYSKILISRQGDLFIPGAFFYIEELSKTGLIHSYKPVVAHTPVVAVHKSKKDMIQSFEDLAKSGNRLAMGDPKAMAFGRIAEIIMERSGRGQAIRKNIVVRGATVKQLALYVAEGMVDAAIIGRADWYQFQDRLEMITIPKAFYDEEVIAVAVLKKQVIKTSASSLQDIIHSKRGINTFIRFGFLPLPGEGE